ncbi:hypothetical protein LM599_05460 [Candidatus Acetothermia bacterium]|nr:hypothetical protein [Candidatus Acetothermia bacterium]
MLQNSAEVGADRIDLVVREDLQNNSPWAVEQDNGWDVPPEVLEHITDPVAVFFSYLLTDHPWRKMVERVTILGGGRTALCLLQLSERTAMGVVDDRRSDF